jgi:hypothetical protein
VILYDAGGVVDAALTDASGGYSFNSVVWGSGYRLQFVPPPGYALSPQDQGADDAVDSDVHSVTGETPVFTLGGFDSHTRWDAGVVLTACFPPDEPIFLSMVTLSAGGNGHPILHFQDANQSTEVTGYNIYRASDPRLAADPASRFAADITDMDAATPDTQWIDTSGDVSPTGIWYFQVTAFNHRCPAQSAEGPF